MFATSDGTVVIIGAGISGELVFCLFVCLLDITGFYILIFNNILGLFAARLLREYDIEVVLLEARDRTGGRTFTQTVRFLFM